MAASHRTVENGSCVPLRIRRLLHVCLLATLAWMTACETTEVAAPRPVVVQIAGSTSMRPVLEELAGAFTERHPNVLIEIRGGNSALGEASVRSGRSVLGASTRMAEQVNPATQTAASESTADAGATPEVPVPLGTAAPVVTVTPLNRAPIGIDGIAIVVHSDNPVTALTADQLQEVFSGRTLDWQELNGDQGEILLVSREDGSGTRQAFESRIMEGAPVSLTAVVMPTSGDVVDYVSKNRFAIGYVSSAFVPALSQQRGPNASGEEEEEEAAVLAIAVDGVLPADGTISDQSYALIQPLYLVTRGAPQGWARQFVDFALSPAGQAIVDRYHVPVR